MKVHLRQIPDEGLHIEGEENCAIPDLEKEGIRCAGPLRYALDVGLTGDSLWANGTLAQPVELQCVSCLERFVHVIRVEEFALHTDLAGPEVVDLAPFVREDILLNLPAHPHCDRHGGLECKGGGVTAERAEEKRKSDWSALDDLKL